MKVENGRVYSVIVNNDVSGVTSGFGIPETKPGIKNIGRSGEGGRDCLGDEAVFVVSRALPDVRNNSL